MGRLSVLAVLLTLAATPVLADSLAEGQAAFTKGDWTTARRQLAPLAAHGETQAAWLLGRLAEQGRDEPPSDGLAWRFYKQAAEGGVAEALLAAADFARQGRGTPVDLRQAYGFYRRAAEAGNARARGEIGLMALDGRGRGSDEGQGLGWLRAAAEADDAEALAAWDRLAGRLRVLPWEAGSTEPPDPTARRLRDEVRLALGIAKTAALPSSPTIGDLLGAATAKGGAGGLAGFLRSDGAITALRRADGSVLVTVPQVVAPAVTIATTGKRPPALWLCGTWRLVFREITPATAQVTVLLPSQILLRSSDGRVTARGMLQGPRLSGRWSFARHGLEAFHFHAQTVAADGPGLKLALYDVAVERRSDDIAVERRSDDIAVERRSDDIAVEQPSAEAPLTASGQGWTLTGRATLAAGPALTIEATVRGLPTLLALPSFDPGLASLLRDAAPLDSAAKGPADAPLRFTRRPGDLPAVNGHPLLLPPTAAAGPEKDLTAGGSPSHPAQP